MELAAVHSPSAAFVAGLVTSLHCAGMCGPLACSLMPVKGDRADAQTVSTVYHLSRLTSYAVLGALAGGLGRAPLTWISQSALRWLPWVMECSSSRSRCAGTDICPGSPRSGG